MNKYYFISCIITPDRCNSIYYNCVISETINNFLIRNISSYQTIHISYIYLMDKSEYDDLKKTLNSEIEGYLHLNRNDLVI